MRCCGTTPHQRPRPSRAFERAIELDPAYGLPHGLLSEILAREWERGLPGSEQALDRAFALAQRAVELADDESTCHTLLGQMYLERRSFDLALRHTERGVEINPANQWNQADLGIILSVARGRAGKRVAASCQAAARQRADPYFGPRWYWRGLGLAQFVLRRYADAVPDFERGATDHSLRAMTMLAGCYARLGLTNRARETIERCLMVRPDATVEKLVARVPFKERADSDHLAECLRLAGFSE